MICGTKIIYSEIARGDLKDIFDYIKGSLKYANLEIKLIRSFLQTIKEDVFIGKPFEKVNNSLLGKLSSKIIGSFMKLYLKIK